MPTNLSSLVDLVHSVHEKNRTSIGRAYVNVPKEAAGEEEEDLAATTVLMAAGFFGAGVRASSSHALGLTARAPNVAQAQNPDKTMPMEKLADSKMTEFTYACRMRRLQGGRRGGR